jgi:hypothetical protein
MNCDACSQEFNLLDRIPYAFQCCGDCFCFQCIQSNSENEMAKCPSCKEETNFKVNQLKPNQKMMKMMEKMKVVCNEHGESIVFRQENIELVGCNKCQFEIQGFNFAECKPMTSEKIYQDLKNLERDF